MAKSGTPEGAGAELYGLIEATMSGRRRRNKRLAKIKAGLESFEERLAVCREAREREEENLAAMRLAVREMLERG